MQPIKINVVGTLATITQNVTLTTGLVGQTVAFTFDKAWDGLSRCAVFKAGNAAYTQLNIGEESTIPPELLRIQGRQVSVGVYGFNAEGTVVIPTVWTLLGSVKHGANPNGQESATPTLPIWAQLAERCQELEEQIGNGGGGAAGDFPAFEKIEGVVEYNEIAKATEVSTVDELLAFDGNAILRDYRHEGSKVTANTSYDVLKIPVQPGDVIRDMLGSYWKSPSNTSPWKYAYFYNANNTIIQNISIKYAYTGTSTSDTMVDYLDLRNNGLTAPDGASFVLLNLFVSYERLVNGSYVSANTLQKCDIVTVNQPAELTAYDGTTALEPYVPQDGPSETYYEAIDDVRIPRYEYALGDIETALDGIIATQERFVGGGTE